jgi:hypothetical protein
MLDDFDALSAADSNGLLAQLAALPQSYTGPDGLRQEPYGLIAYGEASSLPVVCRHWIDAPLVGSGTQFLFAGGFDYGDAAPLKLSAELAGAAVVMLGYGVHEPDLLVAPHAFSFYTYASYLAYATGHKEALLEANHLMNDLIAVVQPEVETERNPAKALAWSLWNRVPLLLTSRRQAGLAGLLQRVFARVGKSLAVSLAEHPLELVTGAFEGRHQLADDMVALVIGSEDEELQLVREVLSSRVAQIEQLQLPFGGIGNAPKDDGSYALVLWYLANWVAAYLAILHKLDPDDSPVYERVRATVLQK